MEIDFDRLRPNRPRDTDIQFVEFGGGRYAGLVVDGFYRDPDYVRAFAEELCYKVPPSAHPGYVALASLDLGPLVSFVYERIGHLYFASPQLMQKEGSTCQFFRMRRREGDPPRPVPGRPHVDDELLNTLIYLSPPEHCRGGTSFFRHKGTGAEELFPRQLMAGRCPDGRPYPSWAADPALRDSLWGRGGQQAYEGALQAGQASSYDEYWQLIMNTTGAETGPILDSCGGWEQTRIIEMKFNRLVLFPGFLLHTAHVEPDWFASTPQASRLTQNVTFHWPGIPK